MLRLPENSPLPERILRLLTDEKALRLLQTPGKEKGELHTFLCPSLASLDGSTLMLSLDQERTELGRGLVRSLWYDLPIAVWLSLDGVTLKAETRAYRCHIVGPNFLKMRSLAQKENPMEEIACAWQLLPETWRETKEKLPAFEIISPRPMEPHLDHPALHG